MIELMKKTLTMSLGLAFVTKEKVEELGRDLIEKGKISGQESKDYIEELLTKSEESSKEIENRITKIVKDTLKKMNIATEDDSAIIAADVGNIANDVARISEELEELRKAIREKGE
ncbi:MAG: hypothetical protein GY866_40110 [Proteobacteria bacterium]|nr:hypothetical protein [Pseudomonadota bacterium]